MTENLIPSGLVTREEGWFTGEQLCKDTAQRTSLPDYFEFFDDLLWFVLQLLE